LILENALVEVVPNKAELGAWASPPPSSRRTLPPW
jgi:hypothetical protein